MTGPHDFPDFFPLPSRQRDVNMAGEVSSLGVRWWRWQRRRQLPRPAWYSTPSAKIKEQTPRHTIVETFLTLALARARSTGWLGDKREMRVDAAERRRSEARRIAKVRRDGGEGRESEEKRRDGEERVVARRDEEKTGPRGSEKDASFRIGGSRRAGDYVGEGRRELDVRTNAICMILHVLARPGAAPIEFQLSAYVFCLLF